MGAMTPEEFAEKMRKIYGPDPTQRNYDEEDAHIRADELMCQALIGLGYGEGIQLFNNASQWYA